MKANTLPRVRISLSPPRKKAPSRVPFCVVKRGNENTSGRFTQNKDVRQFCGESSRRNAYRFGRVQNLSLSATQKGTRSGAFFVWRRESQMRTKPCWARVRSHLPPEDRQARLAGAGPANLQTAARLEYLFTIKKAGQLPCLCCYSLTKLKYFRAKQVPELDLA